MAWYEDNYHLWGNEEYEDAMEGDSVGILHKRSYPRASIQHSKTCRLCGETGLSWKDVDGKWLLAHGDTIHDCPTGVRPGRSVKVPTPAIAPCVFCGSEKVRVTEIWTEPEVGWQMTQYAVCCNECQAHGPVIVQYKEKAIELWNTRA